MLYDYTLNQRNELTVASHDGQTISYSHDLLGRATEIAYPNGVRGQQVFDERDRLLYRNYQKAGSPLVTLKYAYNQLGQRILDDRTMPNGTQLARFTYNQRLELVKSVRDHGCGPDETHTYGYDLNHNRTQVDGVNYANNLADQLLTVGSGGSLTYNQAGQADNAQGWAMTYNCADQITGIQMPGKSIAYLYDGSGQRVQKTVNGVTSKCLWNGGDIAKEYAGDGSVKADYFLGVGREGIKTGGQWYFYLSDIQGSTLMLTDSSGHSAATYDFSDYGETHQTSGSTALYNPFLYTGQDYDFETSLYHLRARHYSPKLGRFFARDPIGAGGGSNMYAYCAGDPIGHSDPSGMFFDLDEDAGREVDRDVSAEFLQANGCYQQRFERANALALTTARALLRTGVLNPELAPIYESILGPNEHIPAGYEGRFHISPGDDEYMGVPPSGARLIVTQLQGQRMVADIVLDIIHEVTHLALIRSHPNEFNTPDTYHPSAYFFYGTRRI